MNNSYAQKLTPAQAARDRLSDTYGYRARPGKTRHPLCKCKVPC